MQANIRSSIETITYFKEELADINPDYNELKKRGLAALERREFTEALNLFTEYLNHLNEPSILGKKGIALFHLQEYEEALICITYALNINSSLSYLLYYKGLIYLKLRNIRKAIECNDEHLKISDDDAKAHLLRLDLLLKNNELENHIDYLNKVTAKFPEETEFQFYHGILLMNKRNYSSAIEKFKIVVNDNKYNAEAWKYMGFSRFRQYSRKETESIEYFNKAIELKPEDSEIYYFKGLRLNYIYRFEEAIQCFQKAMSRETNPDEIKKYNKKIRLTLKAFNCHKRINDKNDECESMNVDDDYTTYSSQKMRSLQKPNMSISAENLNVGLNLCKSQQKNSTNFSNLFNPSKFNQKENIPDNNQNTTLISPLCENVKIESSEMLQIMKEYVRVDLSKQDLCERLEIYSTFNHKNILSYDGYTELENDLYVKSNKVIGEPLSEKLDTLPDIQTRLMILSNIIDGIYFLHSKGIVINNLNPNNIILVNDHSTGDDPIPMLVNYGLDLNNISYYQDDNRGNMKSDIYSLGMLMLDMLKKRENNQSIELMQGAPNIIIYYINHCLNPIADRRPSIVEIRELFKLIK